VQPAELLKMLLALVNAGNYSPDPGPEEDVLLRDAVSAAGGEGWREMMTQLQAGTRQIRSAAGRWLGGAADVATVSAWIAGSAERARLVASVTNPNGDGQIDPVARFLISAFGSDEQVSRSLCNALILSWHWGPGTNSYKNLIDQVAAWGAANAESSEVVAWTQATIARLKTEQSAASKHDAEHDW
jgi:hypothetical protein